MKIEDLLREKADDGCNFTYGNGLYHALLDGSLPKWAVGRVVEWAENIYSDLTDASIKEGLNLSPKAWAEILDLSVLDEFAEALIEKANRKE